MEDRENKYTYFLLKSPWFRFLYGWTNIKIKIHSDTCINPYFRLEYANGDTKNNYIEMTQVSDDVYQIDMMLLKEAKHIYFYPNAPSDSYTIASFRMRSCSDFLHIYYQYAVIVYKDLKQFKNPYRIHKKSYIVYKKQGFLGMLDMVEKEYRKIKPYGARRVRNKKSEYEKWIEIHEPKKKVLFEKEKFLVNPLLSIIMPTYNTPSQYLRYAINSVLAQSYPHWELCIADDASTHIKIKNILFEYEKKYTNIKVIFRKENGHIAKASNTALSLARGEFVCFLDHDDTLAPNALLEVVKSINQSKEVAFIYSDEDKIDVRGRRFEPHFKSDWNVDMFYSHNYIAHFTTIKRTVIQRVGGFREGYDGAQDYELFLRVLDKLEDKNIVHIPKILYHWRAILGSSALDASQKAYTTDAGLRALRDYFASKDKNILVKKGQVANTYRVTYPLPKVLPLVSILVPTRDNYQILFKCIESILAHTSYTNYEILILDNQSSESETLAYFEKLKSHSNISILAYPYPFNYASLNNFGVKYAKGEVIALLNNDTEIITQHWLSEMLRHALRPDIGAVGAMLYYENDTIQHAGIVLGIGGVANHSHKLSPRGDTGYFARLVTVQNYSAVTGACLLVKKSLYEKVGGLNEAHLAVAFNDVDFCLKLLEEGKRNLWTPFVELYHHESVSRGKEETEEEKNRFISEVDYMQKTWASTLLNDRYYNKNLSNHHVDFRLSKEREIQRASSPKAYQNLKDFKHFQKKYKARKDVKKKLEGIPDSFIIVFLQEDYLLVNEDVRKAIEDEKFTSALEHFILYGYDEVSQGQRRMGICFPYFTEESYIDEDIHIFLAVEKGDFRSGFEHFIYFGYNEFLLGQRDIMGTYPFLLGEDLKIHIHTYFDENAYLQSNPDVKIFKKRGKFESAWRHFLLEGIEDIREGTRALHPDIPQQSERVYAKNYRDVLNRSIYVKSRTPFEYFLYYGAEEILKRKHKSSPF
jgi:GT2 family glycosyltransferase